MLMGIRGSGLAGLVALLWQAAALAEAPPATQPAKPNWQVSVEPDQCVLTHMMDGDDLSALAIQAWAGEDVSQVVITALRLPDFPQDRLLSLTVDVKPDSTPFHHPGKVVRLDAGRQALILSGMRNNFLDALSRASTVAISEGAKTVGPIALTHPASGIGALRKCLNDQLIEWGADPAQFQPGGKTPRALIERDLFVANDALLRMHFSGNGLTARFRIAIGTDGKVGGCERIDAKVSDNVESVACKAVTSKSLFEPARDPNGVPVKGIATFRVMLATIPRSGAAHIQ